jgi:hypothetical protein
VHLSRAVVFLNGLRIYPNNQTSLNGKIRDRLQTQSLCLEAERIEGFIEAQAFLGSYGSASHPPPLPPHPVSKLDRRYTQEY